LKSIPVDDLPAAVALGLRTGFGDDLLRIGGIKAFADSHRARTAAMLQPYQGEPNNRGMLLLDGERSSNSDARQWRTDLAWQSMLSAIGPTMKYWKALPACAGWDLGWIVLC
jgi:predicted amidohydrolase YtcJ